MIELNEDLKFIQDKTVYLNKDIEYLKNITIKEYDIKSAGFSIIKNFKLLPDDEIEKLEQMPNKSRHIYIGKLEKDRPDIGSEILRRLGQLRVAFCYYNNISLDDILAIKKDAIFVVRKSAKKLKIDNFEFVEKNKYTSYIKLGNCELYYSSYDDTLEVKGISDEIEDFQQQYLLKEIKNILKLSENYSGKQMFNFLRDFQDKYINLELDLNCYRTMEPPIAQHAENTFAMKSGYFLQNIQDNMKSEIDIIYNYSHFILPLINLIL